MLYGKCWRSKRMMSRANSVEKVVIYLSTDYRVSEGKVVWTSFLRDKIDMELRKNKLELLRFQVKRGNYLITI